MSTGFAFKQRLHLCSVWNLRIFLVFQLRAFKVGFSRNGPQVSGGNSVGNCSQLGLLLLTVAEVSVKRF